jgi:cysteine desulfurase/selenocysteine lyase
MAFRDAFGDFDGRAWINCSHQGALPLAAAEAGREAIEWKLSPRRMTSEQFEVIPSTLRDLLGELIDAPAEEIILSNGASRGLFLLANGLPLEAGDEVLLMAGDFPSDIMPFLALRDRGITVTLVEPARHMLTPAEVEAALTPATRALCMTWVHSLSGRVADLEAIGTLCRERGVVFIANVTQGLGARPLSVRNTPVDAIVCSGWKWLCGPYATGFSWMKPELRNSLTINQAYWLAQYTTADLGREDLVLTPPDSTDPRRYDVFATANHFNFAPWIESIRLLVDSGNAEIEAYDQALVSRLLEGLDRDRWQVESSETLGERSTLVFISHRDPARNAEFHQRLTEAGVDISFRRGRLRFAPHLYKTPAEIDQALKALNP